MPNHRGETQRWAKHWKAKFNNSLVLGEAGPGGAIYALRDGQPIFAESFGMASVANRMPFKLTTPCGIRSVTKVITDALILKAEQEAKAGKIPGFEGGILDREIGSFDVISRNIGLWQSRYIPIVDRGPTGSFPLVHLNTTLRQIASHNSHIYEIGKYPKVKQPTVAVPAKPVYSASYDPELGWNNLIGLKNMMESLGSVDEIVRQAGAVLSGVDPKTFPRKPLNWTYSDKAGWLTGAICEQLLGDSWYNLVQDQFDALGATEQSYPSSDGNISGFYDARADAWKLHFKGHNAYPVEIPGLAVAYSGYRGPDGKQLFLEPEQSTESGYAIGCAVMSAVELAAWGRNLRLRTDPSTGYLSADMVDLLFESQTGAPDKSSKEIANAGWPAINWGFGLSKLKPARSAGGDEMEIWGSVGQGGFGGYSSAITWVNDIDLVIAVTSNAGFYARDIYAMTADYVENFSE